MKNITYIFHATSQNPHKSTVVHKTCWWQIIHIKKKKCVARCVLSKVGCQKELVFTCTVFQLNMTLHFEYMEWRMTFKRYLRLAVKNHRIFNPFLIKTIKCLQMTWNTAFRFYVTWGWLNNDNYLPHHIKEFQNNGLRNVILIKGAKFQRNHPMWRTQPLG